VDTEDQNDDAEKAPAKVPDCDSSEVFQCGPSAVASALTIFPEADSFTVTVSGKVMLSTLSRASTSNSVSTSYTPPSAVKSCAIPL